MTADPHGYDAAARVAFEREIEAIGLAPIGQRNDQLNTSAFNLGQLVPTWLPEAEVSDALYRAGTAAGLEPAETANTVRSGMQAGMAKPREPVIRVVTPEPVTVLPDTDLPEPNRGLIDWKQFWNEERPEQEWLCEPFIAAGQAVSLYSPAKVGKSLLVLEMAAALATGKPALGNSAVEPMVIAYIDHEQTEDDVHDRLTDLGYGPDDDLSNLHYYLLGDWPPLDTAEGGRVLLATMRQIEARMVILDTVSRAFIGEENDADTFIALYRETIRPLKQNKVAFLRLDHSGKDISKGARGSSAKTGDIDSSWELTVRGHEDSLVLKRKFSRTGYGAGEIFLTRESGPLRHVKQVADVAHTDEVERIIGLLRRYEIPLTDGKMKAGRALRENGEKVRNSNLFEAIRIRRVRAEMDDLELPVNSDEGVRGPVPGSPTGPGPVGDRFSGTSAVSSSAVPGPPPYEVGGPGRPTPTEDQDPKCKICGFRLDMSQWQLGVRVHALCAEDRNEAGDE